MEIERKFLIPFDTFNERRAVSSFIIEQAYISYNYLEEVRVRCSIYGERNVYTLTVKKKNSDPYVRMEDEIEITRNTFFNLLGNLPTLCKHRYVIAGEHTPSGIYTIYVDVYRDGTKIAEVEFSSIEQAESFIPPNWFGSEITRNGHYSNYTFWEEIMEKEERRRDEEKLRASSNVQNTDYVG